MRILCILGGIAITLLAGSCFGSSGAIIIDPVEQALQLEEYGAADGEIILDLKGPDSANNSAITYFVFGSHLSLGDHGPVPLAPQREAEATVAVLGHGEELLDVDLSPWAGFEYIYLRANPCQPQIIVLLQPGTRYVFSSS